MGIRFWSAAILTVGLFAGNPANSVPLNLTALDLQANPNVTFPNGVPTVNGTSLVFGESPNDFWKLITIPLGQFGIAFDGTPTTVALSLNLTVLTGDWDAFIVLGDGNSLLGAAAGDNDNGQGASEQMVDLGNYGSVPNPNATVLFNQAGWPPVGGSFDVNLTFVLTGTQTTMDLSFGSSSGTKTFSQPFVVGAPLSLALIRDNDDYERYQLNSITLDVPNAVPEPATCSLLSLGLIGIAASRRRRQV